MSEPEDSNCMRNRTSIALKPFWIQNFFECTFLYIQKTKKYLSDNNKDLEIIVEARNLDEVQEIINEGGVKRILFDNFDYETTKKAVAIIGGKCQSESSGGITEETITEYAKCGVDFISMGTLTHSVLNFDLSLKAI